MFIWIFILQCSLKKAFPHLSCAIILRFENPAILLVSSSYYHPNIKNKNVIANKQSNFINGIPRQIFLLNPHFYRLRLQSSFLPVVILFRICCCLFNWAALSKNWHFLFKLFHKMWFLSRFFKLPFPRCTLSAELVHCFTYSLSFCEFLILVMNLSIFLA